MAASGDPCVSLSVMKSHLRVNGTDEDALIYLYLENAQHIVMDRLERATTDSEVLAMFAGWEADPDAMPGGVKAAVMTLCAEMFRYRGDDEYTPVHADGRLSLRVESYVAPWVERPLA